MIRDVKLAQVTTKLLPGKSVAGTKANAMDTKSFSWVRSVFVVPSLVVALMAVGLAHKANAQGSFVPIHRYSFANPVGGAPDGSVVTDSAGTADGVVRGAGANFTGTRVTIPGGSSATAAYIDLPNGLFSTNSTINGGSGQVTVEGFVKVTGGRTWSRIFDFGSSGNVELPGPGGSGNGERYIMLSAQIGDDVNNLRFEMTGASGFPNAQNFTLDFPTTFNQDIHFLMTWNEATGQIIMYQNGVLVAQATRTATMNDIQDVNVWLGRSNWTGDQNMQGEFDEFRIYDRVLPIEQARASRLVGPDNLATGAVQIVLQPTNVVETETRPVSFSTYAAGDLSISYQWYRGGSLIPDATNTTYSIASVLPADSGSQFFAIASNFVSGTSHFATSQVATLTVFGDTNPPVLLAGRVTVTNQIELAFSEPLHPDAANNTASYTLTGTNAPAILTAMLSADGSRVILTLDGTLTDCESYSLSVTGVRDRSATGNVIAPSVVNFWNFSPTGIKHRYTFNNVAGNAAGATVPDFASGADGVVRTGTGVPTFTGTRLRLTGGGQAAAPYVDLPNRLLSANSTNNGGSGAVTIEGWVKVTGIQGWSRIFDFGSTYTNGTTMAGEIFGPGGAGEGRDYLFLSAHNGTDISTRQIDFRNEDPAGGGAWLAAYNVGTHNKDLHFVVTWDEATGAIRAYENGVFKAQANTTVGMNALNDVNVWLGRSNWGQDGNMQGEFDEFRMYDRILSTNEIRFNGIGGPDNNFGQLLGFDLALRANNLATNIEERIRALARFSNLGTQDVSISHCVVYSSTDSNVVYISADGVIHTGTAGTATVTASLGGIVDSQVVVVAPDSAPPLLVSARANGPTQIELVFSEPVDEGTAQEAGNYIVYWGNVTNDTFASVQRLADQTRVLLTLNVPLPDCEFVTVQVNFVADQSPLFNQIAADSTIGFFHYLPAGLVHRYTFNNTATATASGMVVPDLINPGAGDATVLGTPASFTGERVVLGGGPSASAAYVDLPNGILSTNSLVNGGSGQVTFEGWTKITGNFNWARILDIGSTLVGGVGGELTSPGGGGEGRDYLFYSAGQGLNVDRREIDIRNLDGTPTSDPAGPGFDTLNFDRDFHWVLTWDEVTGQVVLYENGVQRGSFSAAGTSMSHINDVNVWLGRSNWTGDANMRGEFDEFRVYSRVLGSNEIALNRTIGPDNTLGQPLDVRISATNLQVGQMIRPVVFADFSSISNVDLTIPQCFMLESSDPSVVSNDASGILHAVGPGTATVTVRLGGVSDSALVTVSGAGSAGQLTIERTGANYTITLQGTAGTDVRFQRTTNLNPPIAWTDISTNTLPPSAMISIQDTNTPPGQAFYRVISP